MRRLPDALLAPFLIAASLPCAFSQDAVKEPAAIVELGGAFSHSLTGGGSIGGGDFAVEFTPVKNRLEIEVGTTPLFGAHTAEWDTDVLFKKPWDLSKKVEFMIGAGPEWIHTRQNGIASNAAGLSVALDFMFWPTEKRRWGWFVEPGYEYSFGREHERSFGLSAGLLIAFR